MQAETKALKRRKKLAQGLSAANSLGKRPTIISPSPRCEAMGRGMKGEVQSNPSICIQLSSFPNGEGRAEESSLPHYKINFALRFQFRVEERRLSEFRQRVLLTPQLLFRKGSFERLNRRLPRKLPRVSADTNHSATS